jgi:hypothetical protein
MQHEEYLSSPPLPHSSGFLRSKSLNSKAMHEPPTLLSQSDGFIQAKALSRVYQHSPAGSPQLARKATVPMTFEIDLSRRKSNAPTRVSMAKLSSSEREFLFPELGSPHPPRRSVAASPRVVEFVTFESAVISPPTDQETGRIAGWSSPRVLSPRLPSPRMPSPHHPMLSRDLSLDGDLSDNLLEIRPRKAQMMRTSSPSKALNDNDSRPSSGRSSRHLSPLPIASSNTLPSSSTPDRVPSPAGPVCSPTSLSVSSNAASRKALPPIRPECHRESLPSPCTQLESEEDCLENSFQALGGKSVIKVQFQPLIFDHE